jgi:hypothetical protein
MPKLLNGMKFIRIVKQSIKNLLAKSVANNIVIFSLTFKQKKARINYDKIGFYEGFMPIRIMGIGRVGTDRRG